MCMRVKGRVGCFEQRACDATGIGVSLETPSDLWCHTIKSDICGPILRFWSKKSHNWSSRSSSLFSVFCFEDFVIAFRDFPVVTERWRSVISAKRTGNQVGGQQTLDLQQLVKDANGRVIVSGDIHAQIDPTPTLTLDRRLDCRDTDPSVVCGARSRSQAGSSEKKMCPRSVQARFLPDTKYFVNC
jgi:hypothetical protein